MRALVPALLISTAAWAQATDLERQLTAAKSLYEDLEYERALEQLERAKKSSNSVESDVLISQYEGIIRADMNQKGKAVAAFKTALFLNPNARLPLTVSPKVTELYEKTRADVKEQLARNPPMRLTPNVNPQIPLENVRVESPQRPFPLLSVIALGVAVGAGGAGGIFGVQSAGESSAARASTFQNDVHVHQQNAIQHAQVANALFIGAGVAAVAAVVGYLIR